MQRTLLPAALAAALVALSFVPAARAQDKKEAKCVVSGKAVVVDAKTPRVLVNGQALYFCCENCPKAFAKTPEKFIKDAGKCPVMGSPAKAEVTTRAVVNNNLYYVCCPACDVTGSPEKSLKTLADPVSKKEFRVVADSPRAKYQGQLYLFASPDTRAEFEKDPAKYAIVYGK